MLQSHENWKIEHSQITRNLLSSLVGLTWLSRSQVTKGTGSVVLVTRHSSFTCTIRCTVQCVLYSTGLHLYNMVYSTVQYSTVDVLTSLPSLTWMSGSPRMEAEGVTTTSRTRLQGAITHWTGTMNLCQPTRPFLMSL